MKCQRCKIEPREGSLYRYSLYLHGLCRCCIDELEEYY